MVISLLFAIRANVATPGIEGVTLREPAMPLKSGKSKRVIAANIRAEEKYGKKPRKVAIAIAFRKAGIARKNKYPFPRPPRKICIL